MGSKTRLSSYCTKRANNGVNLVKSRKINTRLARPIEYKLFMILTQSGQPDSARAGYHNTQKDTRWS